MSKIDIRCSDTGADYMGCECMKCEKARSLIDFPITAEQVKKWEKHSKHLSFPPIPKEFRTPDFLLRRMAQELTREKNVEIFEYLHTLDPERWEHVINEGWGLAHYNPQEYIGSGGYGGRDPQHFTYFHNSWEFLMPALITCCSILEFYTGGSAAYKCKMDMKTYTITEEGATGIVAGYGALYQATSNEYLKKEKETLDDLPF